MNTRSTLQHDELRRSILEDEEARSEYESFKLHLGLCEKMKASREDAKLTQEELAQKMHTKKSVIARLEAAGGKGKHSPSLKTLSKYANAIGYNLEIKLKKASG